jgi:RNA polymerase sigma-70 factor (ECF subfamily)
MDSALITRAQEGDQAAFAEIATRTYGRLHSIAFAILRDRALAEDATQQAMLQAWRHLPRLRDPASFEAWSYRLTVHACYAEGRRARRWMPNLTIVPAAEPMAPDTTAAVADREQLERGFRQLTVDQRAVVVLHHLVGMPLDEVARTLDIPPGTARSRLHRALRSMRAALEADSRPTARLEHATQEVWP